MAVPVRPTWLTWVQSAVIYIAAYLAYHYAVHRKLGTGTIAAAVVSSVVFSTFSWFFMRRRWRRTNLSRQVGTRPVGI